MSGACASTSRSTRPGRPRRPHPRPADADSGRDAHADPGPDGDTDRHAHGKPDPVANAYRQPHADTDRHADGDADPVTGRFTGALRPGCGRPGEVIEPVHQLRHARQPAGPRGNGQCGDHLPLVPALRRLRFRGSTARGQAAALRHGRKRSGRGRVRDQQHLGRGLDESCTTAPTIPATPVAAGSATPAIGQRYEVTIPASSVPGNGTYTFALKSASTDSAIFASREDPAHAPELLLDPLTRAFSAVEGLDRPRPCTAP